MGSPFDDALTDALLAVADSLDLDATLDRILQAAVDLTEARYGALGVMSPEGGLAEFRYVGIDGQTAHKIGHFPKGLGLLGQLIEEPHPLRLDDLTDHASSVGFPPGHPRMTAFLGVPIRAAGAAFGNLYLTDKPGGFDAADEARLITLASAAGVAIRNGQLFQAVRSAEMWQAAVVAMNQAVLAGEDSGAVLQLLAKHCRELTDADLALVVTSDEVEAFVEVIEGRGSEATLGLTVSDPLILGCMSTVRPVSGQSHAITWTEGGPPELFERVMCCPIATGGSRVGVLTLLWRESPHHLSAAKADAVPELAAQAAIALSLDEARREQERSGLFQDRDRIARDLHDLVVQRLFASGMTLEVLARKEVLPEGASRSLHDVAAALDETIAQIRGTIFELREGSSRAARRVAEQLSDEVDYLRDALGFDVQLDVDDNLTVAAQNELLNDTVAVVREGLSNVARHAEASSARVDVKLVDDWYCVIVTDDGVGLRRSQRASGLGNLQQRAEARGGHCDVISAKGTTLAWRVPMRNLD